MIVRRLREGDDLTPLVRAGLDENFAFMLRLAREYADGDFDRSGALLLGVYEADALLAVGGVTPDPYVSEAETGRIRHLYVVPAARRRGVARRLLEALVASAPPRYRRLRLRTRTERGAAFYRACGFAPCLEPEATHSLELRAP